MIQDRNTGNFPTEFGVSMNTPLNEFHIGYIKTFYINTFLIYFLFRMV